MTRGSWLWSNGNELSRQPNLPSAGRPRPVDRKMALASVCSLHRLLRSALRRFPRRYSIRALVHSGTSGVPLPRARSPPPCPRWNHPGHAGERNHHTVACRHWLPSRRRGRSRLRRCAPGLKSTPRRDILGVMPQPRQREACPRHSECPSTRSSSGVWLGQPRHIPPSGAENVFQYEWHSPSTW